MKIMSVFGTRPEAIKLAPVILELQKRNNIEYETCVSGQHRQMLDQMLRLFGIEANYDLKIMTNSQSLEHISSKVLLGMEKILKVSKPDLVLVQGDTTTAMAAALAAFYKQIPVAHIEAGLRTDDIYNPYPEEVNRRLISQIATLHFAPTKFAKTNLLKNGIAKKSIFVTGNTVIDALLWVIGRNLPFLQPQLRKLDFSNNRVVLVTTHRRENLGTGMDEIFKAIRKLSDEFNDLVFVFPVHLNPAIQKVAKQTLGSQKSVLLIEPLEYNDLAKLLSKSYFVMTDSGGLQEEAPALGKPVLVLRATTERPEGVKAGTARLVGTNSNRIYEAAKTLITNEKVYKRMARALNPYGDGSAAKQIVDILLGRAN